jgi:hypothetical protein
MENLKSDERKHQIFFSGIHVVFKNLSVQCNLNPDEEKNFTIRTSS